MISKWRTVLLKALHSRRLGAILVAMSVTGIVASMSVPPEGPLAAPSSTAQGSVLAPHPATAPGQSATLMPDGRWLLIGGTEHPGALQIFDPVTEQTEELPLQLSEPRSGQTASLLPDGSVIIFGGAALDGNILSTAERYDPVASTLTSLGDIGLEARAYHTATLMTDGRLLILGGEGAQTQLLTDGQIFDPATHAVTALDAPLPAPEIGGAATLLSNGAVLLWGGTDLAQKALAIGALFDPADNTLVLIGADAAQTLVSTLTTGPIPSVSFSQPAAGSSDSSISAPLVTRFGSHMNVATLNDRTVTLIGPHGVTDVAVTPTDDGMLLFVTPKQDLVPGSNYTLFLSGAQDVSGKSLPFMAHGFVTATLNANVASLNASSSLALANPAAKPSASSGLANPAPVTPVAAGGSGNSGGASRASVSTSTLAATSNPSTPLARIVRGLAGGAPAITPASPQAQTSPTATVVAERWVPSQSNYRGDWRSRNTGLAAQFKPQNDLLRRALYGHPEILAVMKQVTPATVAAGLLKNLVSPEHLTGPTGITAVTGQVLRLNGQPLGNVKLSIGARSVRTDANGEFTLANIPAGHQVLIINGETADQNGQQYGRYEYGVNVVTGQTLALPFITWMTALDTDHAGTVRSPTNGTTILTDPEIPGLQLRIPAGTVIRDAAGKIVTKISITAIPTDQPPFPLPNVPVPTYFTIQPGGAHLEASNGGVSQGAQLIYPNFTHSPAGTRVNFWNYDATGKGWYIYGQGTVTQDRTQVVPDPGVVIYDFSGAMVGYPSNAPPTGPVAGGGPGAPPHCGDPVDCATGLFIHEQVDLAVSDVIPIEIRRTYRPGDGVSRAFGIGTSISYNLFNTGASGLTASSDSVYSYQDLILADGSKIHYPRISQGFGFVDAVYQNTSTPGKFYGSIIQFTNTNNNTWLLTLKDGTQYGFPDSELSATDPQAAAATLISDRNGNTITLTRNNNWDLVQITSPNGRHLNLTYDGYDRIVKASDDIGRTVNYAYDSLGRLIQVTDPAGHTESYTYDGNSNMLTVTDKRGNVMVTNTYDPSNRVLAQIYADGTTSSIAYTLDSTNTYIAHTNFTDERGTVMQVQFNANSYPTQITRGLGTAVQQQDTFSRDPTTNLVTSITDALNRTTNATYDVLGNVTQVTRLAGTSSAVTTSVQYSTSYSKPTLYTDANGNSVQLTYDGVGNLTQVTDQMGHISRFSYDSEGRRLSATDGNGNTRSYYYLGGDLVNVLDALGNRWYQSTDAIGRKTGITNPIGAQATTSYDTLDDVTNTMDPNGAQAMLSYDGDRNLLSRVDKNGHSTAYTYDARNRVSSMTDPLSQVEGYSYEPGGLLSRVIDRSGQVRGTAYDALGRVVQKGYGASAANPNAYTSIVTQTWDAGNRLTQVVDASGAITRAYDGLDRVMQESTPQGTVSYTYDAGSRPTSMTATGEPAVNYSWDAANRLTQIQQGPGPINGNAVQSVNFQYDNAGRRTQTTLSNGVVVSYTYDKQNEVTGITYNTSNGTTIGNLTYTYNPSGALAGVGGSLANALVPSVSIASAFDADNRLIQSNGSALSSDANGNMLSDGTNTYRWDSRNRLASIAGAVSASFAYDALNRRVQKQVAGSVTGYLYDDINYIQEQSATGGVTAAVLAGVTDEVFARETSAGTVVPLSAALQSVIGETNSAQALVTQYGYDPYGVTVQTGPGSGNRQQYTGRENDGAGLYYYRARYYVNNLARFLSEDPAGYRGGENLYSYVAGNPMSYVDPTGLSGITGLTGVGPPSWMYNLKANQPFPGNGTISGDIGDQDNKCTVPVIGPAMDSNPCILKCCQGHDNCYATYRCNSSSWWGNLRGFGLTCQWCNSQVATCITDSLSYCPCNGKPGIGFLLLN